MPANETSSSLVYACFVRKYKRVLYAYIWCLAKANMRQKYAYTRIQKTHIYMRLKCLVKSIHWIRAHTSRTHFETNGQPYDITDKYLYVKFPRMKILKCKTFKNIYQNQSSPVHSNCPVQSMFCTMPLNDNYNALRFI